MGLGKMGSGGDWFLLRRGLWEADEVRRFGGKWGKGGDLRGEEGFGGGWGIEGNSL